MVPCLNDNDDHITLLKSLIERNIWYMNSYLLFKSLHLIAVVSWMAGLLYLPRIFVYHVENKEKKETTDIFEVMEKRLFFYIMRPAMIFTWVFGLVLIYLNGIDIFSQFWFQIKIVVAILLSAYNDYLGKCLLALKNSTNTRSAKFFRIINEIPTVILIIVVFLAIFKPIWGWIFLKSVYIKPIIKSLIIHNHEHTRIKT